MNFPQYRRLEGFERFYEIIDERTFIEVVVLNGKVNRNRIEATQFPEMLRIQDMLNEEWSYRAMAPSEIDRYFSDQSE